jgi:hypothetical protein
MTKDDQVWFDKEEDFLSNIEKQCNILYKHHINDYMYYNKMSSRFNIPILIVSSVNALCAISLNDFLGQRYVSILNAVLSAGTGVLGSIQLFMKINEKMTNALRSSINIKRLALKISKELSIDRAQRISEGYPFMTECFSEFTTILEQGNPIEEKMANYLALHGTVPSSPPTPMQRVAERLLKIAKTPSSLSEYVSAHVPSASSGQSVDSV